MAQATANRPVAPARFGAAYHEVHQTITNLTPDQVVALTHAYSNAEFYSYQLAVARLNDALEVLDVDDDLLSVEPAPAPYAENTANAVLARDRGLLTAADFRTITDPWIHAGLPLPSTVTGDDPISATLVSLDVLTTDRVADELMSAAADRDDYAAVMMLTGYNHGELLAYPRVRRFLDRHTTGELVVDWDSLRIALDNGALLGLGEPASNALHFAIGLRLPADGSCGFLHFSTPDSADTAEVMALAFAHAIGAALPSPRPAPAPTPTPTLPRPRGGEPGAP